MRFLLPALPRSQLASCLRARHAAAAARPGQSHLSHSSKRSPEHLETPDIHCRTHSLTHSTLVYPLSALLLAVHSGIAYFGAPGWTRHTRPARRIHQDHPLRYEHTPAVALMLSALVLYCVQPPSKANQQSVILVASCEGVRPEIACQAHHRYRSTPCASRPSWPLIALCPKSCTLVAPLHAHPSYHVLTVDRLTFEDSNPSVTSSLSLHTRSPLVRRAVCSRRVLLSRSFPCCKYLCSFDTPRQDNRLEHPSARISNVRAEADL